MNLLELLHLLGNGNDGLAGLWYGAGHSFEGLPNSAGRRSRDSRLLQHNTVEFLLRFAPRRAFAHGFPLLVLVGWARDFAEGSTLPFHWSRGIRFSVSEDGLSSSGDGRSGFVRSCCGRCWLSTGD